MARIINLLSVALFVALVSCRVSVQECSINNIKVDQVETGAKVENKAEWKVTISNGCICSQSEVKLSCAGFQSVEPVNPSILSKSGDACLVINGDPIFGFKTPVTFNYAADTKFSFKPIASNLACS